MTTEELLERINFLFIQSQLTKNETLDAEIEQNLASVFDILATTDYENSRAIRSFLFELSAEHNNLFFAALFILLKKQLREINRLHLVEVPELLVGVEGGEEFETLFNEILESNFTRGGDVRLSSEIKIADNISEENLLQIFSASIQSVQRIGESYFNIESGDLQGLMLTLIVARKIALISGRADLFYATLGVFCEKLNLSQNYQTCRDFAEESYFTSFIDGKSDWGYFILFLAFTGQTNINNSLIYANAHLAVIRKNKQVSDLLAKRFLFCLIRFYRNIRFHDDVKDIYQQMKDKFSLSEIDTFNITSTYFISGLLVKDSSIILDIYKYLTSSREFIFRHGKDAALPLLNTIYNLKNTFKENPNLIDLEIYIPILESIVGKDDSDRIRAIAYGDSIILKTIFIEALIKVSETRDSTDFVSETQSALVMADKLIILGFTNQETHCFLLAMLLKADYSLVLFNEKLIEYPKFVRVGQSIKTNSSKIEEYENYSEYVKDNLNLTNDEEFLWLGESGRHIYSLELKGKVFGEIISTEAWNIREMDNWLSKDFSDLSFDTTVKKHGQVEQYLEESQRIDLENIRNLVSFSKVTVGNSDSLLLVKDMDVSGMPHNLILDVGGEFLSHKKAMTCLPSTEWFVENQKHETILDNEFTSSMWIPTEEGDFTLNYLWSKLEDKIEEFSISVSHSTLPEKPLSSDINIISAHGAKDIASFNSLFLSEDKAVKQIERMIGDGKILILFVCHSGSMEKALFRQQILSVVNKFLISGYQAVIAPYWSLHIDIPPIWLPIFFSSMKEGKTVSTAVFTANNRVFEENKNPGAWACLHLYGNPRFGKQL